MYKITDTDLVEETDVLTQTFHTGRVSSKISINFQERNGGAATAKQEAFMLDGSPLNIEETIEGRHFSEEGKSIDVSIVMNHIHEYIRYCEQNNFSV